MSFWNDFAEGFTSVYTKYIPGLFTGDTYFPDNPVRELRAKELATDCQSYASKNALVISDINNELKKLNSHLRKTYSSEVKNKKILFEKFRLNNMEFEIPTFIAPIITSSVVSEAMTIGATSYLLSTGEIGAAGLVALVGLPAGFEVASMAATGGATVGIIFVVGSVVGNVKRDKLRHAIHEGYSARTKLACAWQANQSILQSITVINSSIEELKSAEVPLEAVEEHLKIIVDKSLTKIEHTNQSSTTELLSGLDHQRGSWLNEDS